MAFEAYLQQGATAPSRGRRITYTVSVVVHAAAVLVAVAYSFWHVEELTPPRVQVTFISAAAAPPPPPPPPPLGGGAPAPKHKAVVRPKVEVAPKTPDVVQPKPTPVEPPKEIPKETAPETPKEDAPGTGAHEAAGPGKAGGVAGGVANGVKGGVPGGTATGSPPSPLPATKMLPPQMGAQQKLSGADPDFPAYLRQSGTSYVVMAKIIVGISGAVESVVVLKHGHPTLDNNVVATVKTWKFRPLMANGTPVPFSYFGRFEFKSE